MKKNNSKSRHQGRHCINLYVDFDKKDAGCFIQGNYNIHKAMLIAAAMENPTFGRAFLDAALDFANMLVEREKGGKS